MNEPNLSLPAGPGSYVLLIRLESPQAIEVGRLGAIDFDAGCYAYIGSALRGIRARVNRHLRRQKKLHWHVDYLLQHGQLSEVIWALSQENDSNAESPTPSNNKAWPLSHASAPAIAAAPPTSISHPD